VVLWLEDRVIRHLDIASREPLRSGGPGDAGWESSFDKYLSAVECPVELPARGSSSFGSARVKQVEWLAGFAVSLLFEADEGGSIVARAAAGGAPHSSAPATPSSSHALPASDDPLASDSGVRDEALHLARMLGLSDLEGSGRDILQRCGLFLRQKVLPFSSGSSKAADVTVDASKISPGFTTGDKDVDAAVVVLRMLYVGALRERQDLSNAIVETAQAVTMNVRTDSRLGKVGR